MEMQLVVAETKNEELKSQVKEQKKTIDGLRHNNEELAAEKEQLNKRIKAKDDRIQELMQQKEALKKEKNAAIYEKEKSNKQASEKLNSALAARSDRLKLSVFVTAFLSLLIGATIAFSTAFTLEKWWQWQHFIGALGGLLLFGATFFYWIFYAKDDLYIKGGIVFAALLAINTLLILFFKSAYVTVSFWMSGYLIAVSVLAAYCAFKDDEPVVGTILVIDAVLSILSIVLMAVFSAKLTDIKWWQWEHVIGALVGVLLLNFEYFLGYTADDGFYKIECAVLSVLLVINAILTPILLVPYQIVSFWVSGCLIAVSALMAYVDFVDDEPLFGGILVGEGVLSIVSIVLTAVLI